MSSKKRSSAKPRSQSGKARTSSGSPSGKGKAAKRASVRERVAAERAAQRRRERTRWIITFAATGAVVVALGAGAAWAIASNHKKAEHPAADKGTGRPPWPTPANTLDGAKAAGLAIAPAEGTTTHYHTHLDVMVNGQKVTVPANLGISSSSGLLAELHTHDDTGVLHIESPSTNKRFTLGQVFSEWNVRLTPTQIGGLTADAAHTLTAYVDGKQQSGDPAAIQLTSHREIALVYGPAGAKPQVPSSYKFPQGL